MDDDMRVKKVGEMIAASMAEMICVFDEIGRIRDAKKRKQALVAVLAVVQIAREAVMEPTAGGQRKDDVAAEQEIKI